MKHSEQEPPFRLPLFLNGNQLPTLVVGAGRGAVRKIETLKEAGVRCTVVAPWASPQINHWAQAHEIEYIQRPYQRGDCQGFRIVIAATQDVELNESIEKEARSVGALFASLSHSLSADFHFAATYSHQGVRMAVTTDYRLPEVSRTLRDRCQEIIPQDFEKQLQQLSYLRQLYLQEPSEENQKNYSSYLKITQESLHKP